MEKNKSAHVLINPASRSGAGLKAWEGLKNSFSRAGVECQVHFSDPEGGMEALASRVTQEGEEQTLLVLGGDGTLNEVLQGIKDFSRVTLGYIPTGSSNDFARAIGIHSPQEAAEAILASKRPLVRDLGEVTYVDADTGEKKRRYFNVSAGLGFDAAACMEADRSPFKKILNRLHLGKVIYLGVSIRLILGSRLYPFRITLWEGASYENLGETAEESDPICLHLDKTLFAVCMNHGYEGGGFLFCPKADAADGMLDLCAASGISRLKFFQLFPKAYTGAHVGHKGITNFQARRIAMKTPSPLWLHTDGEALGRTDDAQVRILPGKVKFWA